MTTINSTKPKELACGEGPYSSTSLDDTCRTFCLANPGKCDDVAEKYCGSNGFDKFCKCTMSKIRGKVGDAVALFDRSCDGDSYKSRAQATLTPLAPGLCYKLKDLRSQGLVPEASFVYDSTKEYDYPAIPSDNLTTYCAGISDGPAITLAQIQLIFLGILILIAAIALGVFLVMRYRKTKAAAASVPVVTGTPIDINV
jgi:hypothetical protein